MALSLTYFAGGLRIISKLRHFHAKAGQYRNLVRFTQAACVTDRFQRGASCKLTKTSQFCSQVLLVTTIARYPNLTGFADFRSSHFDRFGKDGYFTEDSAEPASW